MKQVKDSWKRFRSFLQEDTWLSFFVTLVLAFLFIKLIFFPGLSFVTGTELPLVIVESCSMYHYEYGFEKIFDRNLLYKDYEIELEDTESWPFQNGLNKGDVIFVVGADSIDKGDVIIFHGGTTHPLIHRNLEDEAPYATKGDNYRTNAGQLEGERNIREDKVVGKAVFRVPFVGWAKLIFFESARPDSQKGFCDKG